MQVDVLDGHDACSARSIDLAQVLQPDLLSGADGRRSWGSLQLHFFDMRNIIHYSQTLGGFACQRNYPIRAKGYRKGLGLVKETDNHGDREQVAGLAKGLAVIEAFGQQGDWLTLSEVARPTGLSPASARRCLRTLESLGYASSDGRYFNIAPRALRLGHAYLASNALPKVAQQAVEHLTEVTHDAASVGGLDGTDVVGVAGGVGRRTLARGLGTGARLPAYCSAMGRMLLADWKDDEVVDLLRASTLRKLTPHTRDTVDAVLDEVRAARAQGYAVVDGELELGSRSIAVPIRTKRLAPPAAISLAVRGADLSVGELVERCLPLLEGASGRMAGQG